MDRAVLKNKIALIIEDDAHSLLALGSLLDGFGIEYKRNTTGASVLEQARRLQPDLILLDLSLPDGDPFLICEALHQDEVLGKVPVIAMIDEEITDAIRPAIRNAEFAGLVAKPVDQRTFTTLLRQLFSSR